MYFMKFFHKDLKNIIMVSSSYIDKDEDKGESEILKRIKNAEIDLQDYLSIIEGNIYYGINEETYQETFDEKHIKLNKSFKVFRSVHKDVIKKMSLVFMDNSNVAGHCFFVLEKQGLIIYPHGDNTGYGVISYLENSNDIGYKFLTDVPENFVAHLCIDGVLVKNFKDV